MRLNADIIYSELKKTYNVEISGPGNDGLSLPRPEFYMDNEEVFHSDHLYLATVEHLPQRPRIQENSVLVCIGDSLTLRYYRDKICLIIIRSRADFFKVYHMIQRIYDKYDAWEHRLLNDLITDASISNMLGDSKDIFNKPVYVLDKSFRVIASTLTDPENRWSVTSGGSLDSSSISTYLSAFDLMTDRRNAIKLNLADNNVLCVNLFNKNDQYEGCVVISLPDKSFVDGEDKLAEHLAECIQQAIARNPQIINDPASPIKKAFQNLVEELPLSYSQRLVLTSSNKQTEYRCICMQYSSKHNHLPMSYICDIFEDTFKDSYAFVYDNSVVAFVNTSILKTLNDNDPLVELNGRLGGFIRQIGLCAGISSEFSDLFNIKIHYLQSLSAVENGLLLAPEEKLFYFESYALTEMVINSLGGLPVEAYFPSGFVNLLEHDKDAGISYLETLKAFLEENMSYTSTARRLYIHRSTLLDRITRIERDLGIDLKDPDKRLLIELLLKAIDLEELLGKK